MKHSSTQPELKTGLQPDHPIEVLDLPVRAYSGLKRAGIDRVSQVLAMSDEELLNVQGIGISSLTGIKIKLDRYRKGIFLPMAAAKPPVVPSPTQHTTLVPSHDDAPIDVLGLSVRPYNVLIRAGIHTVSQLAARSDQELFDLRNLGETSLAEIRQKLDEYLTRHPESSPSSPEPEPPVDPLLSPRIDVLQLSTRAHGRLNLAGVETISQLLAMKDENLLQIGGLGPGTVREIRKKLESYLRMRPEQRTLPAAGSSDHPDLAAARTRRPLVSVELRARAKGIPLDDISLARLLLPTEELDFLSRHGVSSIGTLVEQPEDAFAPGSNVPDRLNRYLKWLVTQDEGTHRQEVDGLRASPLHRILLSEVTLDELISSWLESLGKPQQEVLQRRLGYSAAPMTLEEVGQQMGGVSGERVRQVQNRALKRLRADAASKPVGSLVSLLEQEFADRGGLMAEDEVSQWVADTVRFDQLELTWATRLLLHGSEVLQGPEGDLWALRGRPLDLVPLVNEKLLELLDNSGGRLTVEELLVHFAASTFGRKHRDELDDALVSAVLRVSADVDLKEGGVQRVSASEKSAHSMACSEARTLLEWEQRLRPQVERVELLGEIPITAEECAELGKLIGKRLAKVTIKKAMSAIKGNYPCSFAVFLVAQGIYGYGGIAGYWPGVGQALGMRLGPNWAGQFGLLLETVLSSLSLPLFPDLGGRRYVDLVLLHGGIPNYSLSDFFANMIQPGVTKARYAGMSATELIDEWLWHTSGRHITDKPVLRFLEFGGAVAQDFCERCLEMALETADSGLVPEVEELAVPRRVVDAYRTWVAEQDLSQVRREVGGHWQLHKPEIVLNPWGEGVILELPPQQVPATEIESHISWQMTVGDQLHRIPLRVRRIGFDWKTSQETLALSQPAAEHEVTLLANDDEKRTWRYQGLDDERPLLAFDPERGTMVAWKHSLPARCLWLVYPRRWNLKVVGQGELLEDLPRLPWGWSDFRGETWELTGAQSLRLSSGETTLEVPLRLDQVVQRPYLEGGQIVSTGASRDSVPVYVGVPPVVRVPLAGRQALEDELSRWRVTVRNKWAARPDVEVIETLADLYSDLRIGVKYVDLPLQLPSLLGTEPFGNFEIRLRGPLGRDARFTLRLVPHLKISGHEEFYLPDVETGPRPVNLRAETLPEFSVECQGMGEDCRLTGVEQGTDLWLTQFQAEPHVTAAELIVLQRSSSDEAIRVPVTVPIRRLQWALLEEQAGSGQREWTGRALRRPVDALLQARSACLLVDLPRTETDKASLRLRLLDVDGKELQRTDWVTAPSGQRLWRFELAAFFDTIRQAGHSPFLRFELEAYGLPRQETLLHWPVLSLTRILLVENVQLKARRVGSRTVFDLRWSEPLPLTNRLVRFWPLWRPWDAVFEQAIPDAAEEAFTFEVPPSRMQSRKHRLEFLVIDPWVPQVPQMPAPNTPGTVDVKLVPPARQMQLLEARIQKQGERFELLLERAVLHHDMGNPEKAQPDLQWCYQHLDDGTVPQILVLAGLAQAGGDREMLGKLQLKMFAISRFEPVFHSQKQDQLSWEEFHAYLANLPRWERLPTATCVLLLSVDDETVRLQALQQLIRRRAADGIETVLAWVEAAQLSDADAIAILSLNAGFAVELLREQTDRGAARRLLAALSQTVEDVVRVGNWLHCNLGWGRVEEIEHLDRGGRVQWCMGGQSRYRLHVVLRPDEQPEMVTIDLASSTADFCEPGAVRTCAECGHFMTQKEDLMPKHYEKAHPARGYWDRRYRQDEYAKFRFEDRPIAISFLALVSQKPGKQLV